MRGYTREASLRARLFRGFFVLFFAPALALNLAFANEGTRYVPAWDPSLIVPGVTLIGTDSPDALQQAQRIRDHLVHNLDYWRRNGLPQPPTIGTVAYISDASRIGYADVLQALNPDTPNIVEALKTQFQIFESSYIAAIVEELAKRKNKDSKKLLHTMFDRFVLRRFGFTVQGALAAAQANTALVNCDRSAAMPVTDNAIYFTTINIDLKKVLPKNNISEAKRQRLTMLSETQLRLALSAAMNQMQTKAWKSPDAQLVHRIIILPSHFTQAGEAQADFFYDVSIAAHEQGHHIVDATPGIRRMDRVISEALADYLAAAPSEDSRIGAFFASAAATLTEQMKDGELTEDQKKVLKNLEAISNQGVLRDLNRAVSIDDLARSAYVQNEYDSGAPVRSFLWRLREHAKYLDLLNSHEQIVLAAMRQFTLLPEILTKNTRDSLDLRGAWQSFRRSLIELFYNRQSEASDASNEAVDRVLINYESFSRGFRKFWNLFGFGLRPAIAADYIIPEFFRAFYRAASLADPNLLQFIREEAERSMNSPSVVIEMPDGTKEIVFIRTSLNKLNPVARATLPGLLRDLAVMRTNLAQMQIQKTNPALRMRTLKEYRSKLEALQEFERTGSTFRLFFPRPFQGLSKVILKQSKRCAQLLLPAPATRHAAR